ncbi:hypothetical protein ACQ4PT_027119 [Festuca glaucescens]
MSEGTPRSRLWSVMVEEDEAEELSSSEASSRRSYSDVVRDGSPSPETVVSSPPPPRQGGAAGARPQGVRPVVPVVEPRASRAADGGGRRGGGGGRGPQPKRRRGLGPLSSHNVPPGVSAGFAGLCFNCAEPGHVAGMCKGPRRCLICKSELHVVRNCPQAAAPVAGEVALGAPPPPRGGPPPARAPPQAAPMMASGEQVERYRAPARQRVGLGEAPPPPRPSIKDRLGERGGLGGLVLQPVIAGRNDGGYGGFGGGELPFERGLRREWEVRAAEPLRPEESAAGLSLLDRERRREKELRAAALSAVVAPLAAARDMDVVVPVEVEAARPAQERGFIYRTPEVDCAERALRWGLVAFVTGTRRPVSCRAASAAVLERYPELEGYFSVHAFWPAELLLVFDTRANRDVLLSAVANPLDGRDFSLRFGVWNRQLQAMRRKLRYHVHLEVVGVPTVAWSLDTAKTILSSSGWVERLGSEIASRADMGSFRITAWTDDLVSLPKSKRLWLAEPLVFEEDDDDLLLPVEALIPEEVALLEYEATVHMVKIEDTAAAARRPPGDDLGHGPGGARGEDSDSDDCGGGGPPARGHHPPPREPPRPQAAPAAAAAGSSTRRWRGGAERRVALGTTTVVRPWPVPAQCVERSPGGPDLDGQPAGEPEALVATSAATERELGAEEADEADGGFSGFHRGASLSPEASMSQAGSWSTESELPWPLEEEVASPTGPLLPTFSVGSLDSWRPGKDFGTPSPMSMFTVVLSEQLQQSAALGEEVEEGEIVEVDGVEVPSRERRHHLRMLCYWLLTGPRFRPRPTWTAALPPLGTAAG